MPAPLVITQHAFAAIMVATCLLSIAHQRSVAGEGSRDQVGQRMCGDTSVSIMMHRSLFEYNYILPKRFSSLF